MNKIKVEIFNESTNVWEDFSSHVVYPFKFANLLDEQLDEAELQLQYINRNIFEPLTKVKITILNTPEARFTSDKLGSLLLKSDYTVTEAKTEGFVLVHNEDNKRITVTKEYLMLVANDTVTERPIGSEKYNHQLYLIEFTKFLEGFIGDSLTFTNTLGNSRATNTQYSLFNVKDEEEYEYEYKTQTYYKAIYKRGTSIALETNVSDFANCVGYPINNSQPNGQGIFISTLQGDNVYKQYIEIDYSLGFKLMQQVGNGTPTMLTSFSTPPLYDSPPWQPYTLQLNTLGNYKIKYVFEFYTDNITVEKVLGSAESTFVVAENTKPVKKWTIADVISRTLETIEPLRGFSAGLEFPRFWLAGTVYYIDETGICRRGYETGSLAEKLDKILAPEFTFTKMTLREMLQQVGGFIHGEPRISGIKGKTVVDKSNLSNNKDIQYYEITFDMYGQTAKTYLSADFPYLTREQSININEFCTNLDSSASNLINTLNYAQGVVIEPFRGQYKTVRTTQATVRLEDAQNSESVIIETTKPIYEIGLENQLIVRYNNVDYDISSFVFTETEYNNMSSYENSDSVASKAFALYYTPGEKNIKGLFFKNPDAVNPYFQKYAISNILSSVTGVNIDLNINSLINCFFKVSYVPYSKERVKTAKPIVKTGLPRALAYNQSANAIETRYYGENLKGVISRLGNVEKTVTYMFAFLTEIPRVGLKYDDSYYISSVSVEVLPTCFKATLGLSKNFNRQSEHIAINSEKRMWEVSEKQTTERETVITDYVLINEIEVNSPTASDSNVIYSPQKLSVDYCIARELLNVLDLEPYGYEDRQTITALSIAPLSKNGNNLINGKYLRLPVTSTAFGNTLVFSASLEDNYSAGQGIIKNNSNYYSNYVPYTDFWGRVYSFELYFSDATSNNNFNYQALQLPLADTPVEPFVMVANKENENFINYQKDNREVPSLSYQMQLVSDGSVIIGSALASNCRLVNTNPLNWTLVLLRKEISVINNERITADDIKASYDKSEIRYNQNVITLPLVTDTNYNYKAWALITEITPTTINVVDEDGVETTQTIYEGGEILIGQNKQLDKTRRICFKLKSDIYKKI